MVVFNRMYPDTDFDFSHLLHLRSTVFVALTLVHGC